jgi:hypothetical protein
VVIATVFLTIIAMIIGFMLGERHRERVRSEEKSQNQPYDPGPGPSSFAPEKRCPKETEQTAAGLGYPTPLGQVLRIETDNETTVWICEDQNGKFYYQGRTGGLDADLVEGHNGLFLTDVTSDGSDEFQARAANGNRIVVTRERLEVHFASGKATQVNRVVKAG